MARKTKQPASTTATPQTYAAWRDAAEHDLIERHGIRTNVRAKQWREWYIRNMTPKRSRRSSGGGLSGDRAHCSIAPGAASGSSFAQLPT